MNRQGINVIKELFYWGMMQEKLFKLYGRL